MSRVCTRASTSRGRRRLLSRRATGAGRPRFLPMEDLAVPAPRRRRLLAKFTGVALIGFAVSALILHLGLGAGLRPWAARLVALLCAMNVTFLINGRFVSHAPAPQRFFPQRAASTANSPVGNFWH